MKQKKKVVTDETQENPKYSIPRRFWFFVVLFCFFSSVFVQLSIPFIQEVLKSFICLNPLVIDSSRRALGCITNEQRSQNKRLSTDIQRVTYFDEPFPIEPWVKDDGSDVEDVGKCFWCMFKYETFILEDLRLSVLPKHEISSARNPYAESEALAALQAAKKSRECGNVRKAEVIIEHAFALAPHHPDIITEYGIFMETVKMNVLEAEGLYKKALTLNPTHSEALM